MFTFRSILRFEWMEGSYKQSDIIVFQIELNLCGKS